MHHLRLSGLCLLLLAAALVVLVAHGVVSVRESANDGECQGRFNQLCFALINYHDTKGHFPPAFLEGPDGKPWHSWRVLILPYMEGHQVYEKYRFDEPWNGPNNRLLADKIHLKIFQCCSGPDYGKGTHTNIVAIVGDGTAFPGAGTTRLADFRDGGKHTILLAEYRDTDIHWMEPRDLNLGTMSFAINDPAAPSISSPHPAGPAVVFPDRITAYRLRQPLSIETLGALVKTNSDKRVWREDLLHTDRSNRVYLSE